MPRSKRLRVLPLSIREEWTRRALKAAKREGHYQVGKPGRPAKIGHIYVADKLERPETTVYGWIRLDDEARGIEREAALEMCQLLAPEDLGLLDALYLDESSEREAADPEALKGWVSLAAQSLVADDFRGVRDRAQRVATALTLETCSKFDDADREYVRRMADGYLIHVRYPLGEIETDADLRGLVRRAEVVAERADLQGHGFVAFWVREAANTAAYYVTGTVNPRLTMLLESDMRRVMGSAAALHLNRLEARIARSPQYSLEDRIRIIEQTRNKAEKFGDFFGVATMEMTLSALYSARGNVDGGRKVLEHARSVLGRTTPLMETRMASAAFVVDGVEGILDLDAVARSRRLARDKGFGDQVAKHEMLGDESRSHADWIRLAARGGPRPAIMRRGDPST